MTKVMTHELIHAFDDCRAKVNFRDIKHLACTEVYIYVCVCIDASVCMNIYMYNSIQQSMTQS